MVGVGRGRGRGLGRQGLAVQAGPQNRLDGAVAVGAGGQGPGAGGLQALGAVAVPEAHDAQAGAEPLLGMASGHQDGLDQSGGARAGAGRQEMMRPGVQDA